VRALVHLVRLITLRHMLHERARCVILLLGVSLGVGVFAGIRIANHGILQSFRKSVESISGNATLQITAHDLDFDERLFSVVRKVNGVQGAAPVVTAIGSVKELPGETLIVLGVDVLKDRDLRTYHLTASDRLDDELPLERVLRPDTVILTKKFADHHGYGVHSPITLLVDGREKTLRIVGLLDYQGPAKALGGNFALMDIATAQVSFGRIGRLDRIDVVTTDGLAADAVGERLRKVLPPAVKVERPQRRNEQVEKMLRSFRLNLNTLGLIALFVGMFLIYNTISISVVRRRTEIGILRAVGVGGRQIFLVFLAEAALLGIVGSIAGLGLGVLLARGAIYLMSAPINDVFFVAKVDQVAVPAGVIWQGLLLGCSLSVLSSILPSREATLISPTTAMQAASYEVKSGAGARRLAILALALFTMAWVFSLHKAVWNFPVLGYLASFCVVMGSAFATPSFLQAFHRAALPCYSRLFKAEGRIACSNLLSALGRNAVAIAALSISLAMMFSVAIMVASFRKTVDEWINQVAKADLYLTPAGSVVRASQGKLPEGLVPLVEAVDGVGDVDPFRGVEVEYRDSPVLLASGDLRVAQRYRNIPFKGGDADSIFRKAYGEGAVIISESFSVQFAIDEGDRLRLVTPSGEKGFDVAGVYYNYTNDLGVIVMDRQVYKQNWGDAFVTSLAIYIQPGAPVEEVRERILRELGNNEGLLLVSNHSLKEEVLRVFDQAFQITWGLLAIAIVVASLGVANALLASVFERRHEIGILRAVGTTRRQVQWIVVLEAALMGISSNILGAAAGLVLSLILIFVINKQSFGWTIQFSFPHYILLLSIVPVLVTSLAAGYFPSRQAARLGVTEALHYE